MHTETYNPKTSLTEKIFNFPEAYSKHLYRPKSLKNKENFKNKVANFFKTRAHSFFVGTTHDAANIIVKPLQGIGAIPFWAGRKVCNIKRDNDTLTQAISDTFARILKGLGNLVLTIPGAGLSAISPNAKFHVFHFFRLYNPTIYTHAEQAKKIIKNHLKGVQEKRDNIFTKFEKNQVGKAISYLEEIQAKYKKAPEIYYLSEFSTILEQDLKKLDDELDVVIKQGHSYFEMLEILDGFNNDLSQYESIYQTADRLDYLKNLHKHLITNKEHFNKYIENNQLLEEIKKDYKSSSKINAQCSAILSKLNSLIQKTEVKSAKREEALANRYREIATFFNNYVDHKKMKFKPITEQRHGTVAAAKEKLGSFVKFFKDNKEELSAMRPFKRIGEEIVQEENVVGADVIESHLAGLEILLSKLTDKEYELSPGFLNKATDAVSYITSFVW